MFLASFNSLVWGELRLPQLEEEGVATISFFDFQSPEYDLS